MPRRSSIVCSKRFTLCINSDGNVVSFGSSKYGSHGHEEHYVFPPKIISSLVNIKSVCAFGFNAACLDYDGCVFTFGSIERPLLNSTISEFTHEPQKVNLPPCIEISCGDNHTVCLTENREVYSFGYNSKGQLGVGNNEVNPKVPQKIESLKDVEFIECGELHVFCKTRNNEVYCWGS